MNLMFTFCDRLSGLDLSRWNTGSVIEMGGMFYGCIGLRSLDLSGWDMSNVQYVFFLTEYYERLDMLGSCDSLSMIRTPLHLECEVELPVELVRQDDSGEAYTMLPLLQTASITLVKGIEPFGEATFILPASTAAVEANAFEGAAMTVVSIPASCGSIGNYAFKDCTQLAKIRIPKNCTLGTDVFDGCTYVLVYGAENSPAARYCQTHDNCVFVKDTQN